MATLLIVISIAFTTAIIFTLGYKYCDYINRKYPMPRLYTLVIETYDTDFMGGSSNYEVKKFASAPDRNNFVDRHMSDMITKGFDQDVATDRLVNSDNSIYICYHSID